MTASEAQKARHDLPNSPYSLDDVIVHGYSRRLDQWRKSWKMRRRHMLLMICTLLSYGFALSVLDGKRELASAAWREILGELYPDASKSAERITEGEVSPRWSETMHADDVTKNLNWFQTFCRTKNGMDDHLPFFWRCNINHVSVDYSPLAKSLSSNMNCSRDFIDRHIVVGDDPRCVPWGQRSLGLLSQLLRSDGDLAGAEGIGRVDPMYDEFTVHAGAPLFDSVHERFDALEQELDELQTLVRSLSSEALKDRRASAEPIEAAPRRLRHGRRTLTASGGMKRLGLISDMTNVGGAREEPGCEALLSGCPNFLAPAANPQEVPCHCFEAVSGEPTSTCRNHHWGLVHLCRPGELVVTFEIRRVVCDRLDGVAMCTAKLWFTASMIFTAIQGNDSADYSGWYSASLHLGEGKCFGNISYRQGAMGFVAIGFLLWFLLQGPVWAIVCLPRNMAHVLELQTWKSPSTSDDETESLRPRRRDERSDRSRPGSGVSLRVEFEKRLGVVLSGIGNRTDFMARMDVICENIGGLLIICGFITSTGLMWERHVRSFDINGKYSDVSAWQYTLSTFDGFQLVSEVLYQGFFDSNAFHSMAWFLLYVTTTMCVFDSFEGLQWLPAIARLSATRMTYFIFAYCLVILGFGIVLWLEFGARFVQFSSLRRASYELFFLSCGVPFHVFDDINPSMDNNSFEASCFLALYLIIVVIVGLNFFTTIILDAYSLSKKPREADYAMNRIRWNLNEAVMALLKIGHPFEDGPESDSDMDFDPLRSPAHRTVTRPARLFTKFLRARQSSSE